MIEPVRVSVTVEAPAERAFTLFTEGLGSWWPAGYTWSRDMLERIAIEPRLDGRCFERGPHGFTCDWGRVLAWDPPQRLVLSWQIGPRREPEPDPGKASEVEVRFSPDGPAVTVELEHREFARHGDGGDRYREQMASPEGWPLILGRYAAAMAAGAHAEAPSAGRERAGSALLDMLFGYMPAQVIHVAAELGIADALEGGPKTNEELAAATGTHPPSLLRLIRALAQLGVLAEVEAGRFDLLPLGTVLRSDEPGSIRELARLFCHDTIWRSWGRLGDSVRTGEVAFEKVTGMDSFAYFARHPALSATFNQAMVEHTRTIAPAVLAGYDFSAFRRVCDVGGGSGALLAAIVAANPDARGILFDTAPGLAEAPASLAAAGVADRCDVVLGDFFDSVPSGADAYVLKSVIHDWDDERSVAILANCRRAMREDAKLLLVEFVVPETADPAELMGIAMSDLNMLVATRGRERTQGEFAGLLKAAGLTLTSVTPALGSTAYRVIEGAA